MQNEVGADGELTISVKEETKQELMDINLEELTEVFNAKVDERER